MNAPMRMSEDCISLALDQRGRVLLRPKSEQCRKHRVISQPVDVDVPRKSADDREHGRADDVADIGGVSYCGWLFLCNSKHTIFRGLLFSFTHCVKHKNRSKAPVSLPQTAIRVIQLPNLARLSTFETKASVLRGLLFAFLNYQIKVFTTPLRMPFAPLPS